MKIQFVGIRPREVVTPGRSITVTPGQVFEVGETLGRSLLDQKRLFRPAPPEPKTEKQQKEAGQ